MDGGPCIHSHKYYYYFIKIIIIIITMIITIITITIISHYVRRAGLSRWHRLLKTRDMMTEHHRSLLRHLSSTVAARSFLPETT